MAEINPIRYRGYYDSETGFYYLQSRYYDPTTCRFINSDEYVSTGQGIIGHNMFAYCLNNPVNMKDLTGYTPVYVITDVKTEEDEDSPNTYHTTVTYIIVDIDNPYSAYALNPQTVTYTYTITDGLIRMHYNKDEARILSDAGVCCVLADEMIRQAITINEKYMSGRTISGVAFELFAHAVAYSNNISPGRANPVDIGATEEGSDGYDVNAAFFENPILNIDILIDMIK